MEKEEIFKHEEIKLTRKEASMLLDEVQFARIETYAKREEQGKIIRKTDLKNHRFLIIEHRAINDEWMPVGVGLLRTKVNEAENTLTGIRVFMRIGEYEFKEYTYNMDHYRKNWRAWTRMPKQKKAWK